MVRFVAHRARKFRIIKEKKKLLSDIYVSAYSASLFLQDHKRISEKLTKTHNYAIDILRISIR